MPTNQNEKKSEGTQPASHPLVDISALQINPAQPKPERYASFISQIKDPGNFLCGDTEIKANFDPNGPGLDECLVELAL